MKYFRVNCGDASGMSEFWEYFALSDSLDIDEAIAMFNENNPWVHSLDCDRTRSEELTEEQYKTGVLFNKMYENKHELNAFRRKHNLYPTREMAEMFAKYDHPSGYVRIGHPNIHNVYKINQDGNLIFVYHHWSDRIGVLE
ncbi:hypothetical protein DQT32_03385 [Salmonella enterica subsp. enterica serovar Braenderup]|nr:hypothetical protein [Salmonella enterica subsp. enterica serovar Braenderup]